MHTGIFPPDNKEKSSLLLGNNLIPGIVIISISIIKLANIDGKLQILKYFDGNN